MTTGAARHDRPRPCRPAGWTWLRAGVSGLSGRLATLLAPMLVALPAIAQGLSVTDDRGVRVTLERPAQRIVSLLPSLTETVCALQACERLVGVDQWSNWPESVKRLPQVSGLDQVSIEALVRLKPDVVLAARSQRLLDRLEALGLRVVALDSDRHEDVRRSLGVVAVLLGRPQAGDALWAEVQETFARAAERVPPALRGRSVYVEIGSGGYAAARSSFLGETMARLGLVNAAPDDAGPFPKLSPEFVLRQPPHIIVSTAREVAVMAQRPGWAALPAVRARRLCGFEPPDWDMLVRPGPRLGQAAARIAACLAQLPATP